MFEKYNKQVELVLTCLPVVAQIKNFALKGGTAINLFIRDDYPRLSVDIDLCYLPIELRDEPLLGIQNGLKQIADQIEEKYKLRVQKIFNTTTKTIIKLIVND